MARAEQQTEKRFSGDSGTFGTIRPMANQPGSTHQLLWIFVGVILWFGIRNIFPNAAALILAAFVVAAAVKLGPQIAQVGKT